MSIAEHALSEDLTEEHSDKKRANSIEEFQLRHIDLPWKQEASKTDDNETIYVTKHMQEYKGLPYPWDVRFANDQVNVLLNPHSR